MRRAVRGQFIELTTELDRLDDQCRGLEERVKMGRTLTAPERLQYVQWVNEGRTDWWRNRKLVRRLRKTARMCARNARRKR